MTISDKSQFVLSLMAGTAALALAMPTLAQAQAAPATDTAKADDSHLGEIVVTAQKRAENLQVVPVAVTAINADKIAKLGVVDSRDLTGLAPNVTIDPGTTSQSAAAISIRGITSGGAETFGLDSANAIYIDGVYIARSAAAGQGISDIDQVEVLRGPQGTLFGRNTTGGAISFVTRKPSATFRLTDEASYGNYDAWSNKLSIDPGEFHGLSTSFSYTHRERNGVVNNLDAPSSSQDPGAYKSDAFRFAARLSLGTTGSIQYILDYSKITGSPMNFQLTNASNGAYNAPVTINGQQVTVTQQAPVAQYLAGATFANPACAALAQPTLVWRQTICNDVVDFSSDRVWGHNLQIENNFGGVKFKSTTGYRTWLNIENSDLDGVGAFSGPQYSNASLFNGMPASLLQYIPSIPKAYDGYIAATPVPQISQNLFQTSDVRHQQQFSEEAELSATSSNLDWVVGGFYFWEKGSEANPQDSGYILDTNQTVFTARNFGPLGAAFAAANPAQYRLVQTLSVLAYETSSQSEAIYAQATYYPGGHNGSWRLTLGGRYTWDQKSMTRTQNGAAPLVTPDSGSANFSKFTWNAMLGYDFAKDITGYARVATGYRSGGFNAGDPDLLGTSSLPHFNAEQVTAYELGLKTELFDRHLRFNLAGYHNIYQNLQLAVPVPSAAAGTFTTQVQNAGSVHFTGVEADAQAILSSFASIDGSIGYVDIKYEEFDAGLSTTGAVVNIASIAQSAYTSPLTANLALNLHAPVGNGNARVFGRIGYTYLDGQYSFASNLSSPFNDAIKGPNRNLFDLQVGVERLRIGGAEGQLKFWMKNMTNEHALVRGIDFGALGYAGGYYEEPRTYGLTLGIKL
jgi:iron complex outermembrane receptor protein